MRNSLFLLSGVLATCGALWAQPGAQQPPLLGCGQQGDVEIICGTRSPEDFEITPDSRYLIVANFGQSADDDSPLDLFEIATKQFTPLPIESRKLPGWGEPSCTSSIGNRVTPHGLSLSPREIGNGHHGEWQLYVVNHNVRESMEMYQLVPSGDSWKLVWHGCVLAGKGYNDVSARPDGSFVATRPQAIQKEGQNLFGGEPTGNVGRWSEAEGESVLAGSEYGYPNGVLVSEDGRYAYISAWTTRGVHKYDLDAGREVGATELSFMPDNLTWTHDGKLLAAGVQGINGNCPQGSNTPCIQGIGVAEIDPGTMQVTDLFDSAGRPLISGASVAFQVGNDIYIGSFQGDRILRIPR